TRICWVSLRFTQPTTRNRVSLPPQGETDPEKRGEIAKFEYPDLMFVDSLYPKYNYKPCFFTSHNTCICCFSLRFTLTNTWFIDPPREKLGFFTPRYFPLGSQYVKGC
ncbi:MAG: hypothetical protein ABWU13_21790, partial [Limnospira maxima]